ncbi:MAG: MBL fold metallo-hydrolase [Planctomycetota bacterium]|jgi:glyoxylase-like metal-dependent hydrolase (beta-lactamase superfamily II)
MIDPADNPQVTEIADGVWVRVEVDTIGWIDLGEWGVVIDTHEDLGVESALLGAIARTLGNKPVRYVLNTHTHYDHICLNKSFLETYGSEIINQDTTPMPSAGRWFKGSRRRVLIQPMIGCHTPEDCVVWVPDCKILFVGDIFGWGLINLMGRLDERSVPEILAVYDKVVNYGAETIVPGHGPVCTPAELARWVEYFKWLHGEVLRHVEAGSSDGQILAAVAPPEDMHDWWRFLQWKHEHSVERMITSIRDGWTTWPGQ